MSDTTTIPDALFRLVFCSARILVHRLCFFGRVTKSDEASECLAKSWKACHASAKLAVETAEALRCLIPSEELMICFQLTWIPAESVISLILMHMILIRENLGRDFGKASTNCEQQQEEIVNDSSPLSQHQEKVRIEELLRSHQSCQGLAQRLQSHLASAPSHAILPLKFLKVLDEVQRRAEILTGNLKARLISSMENDSNSLCENPIQQVSTTILASTMDRKSNGDFSGDSQSWTGSSILSNDSRKRARIDLWTHSMGLVQADELRSDNNLGSHHLSAIPSDPYSLGSTIPPGISMHNVAAYGHFAAAAASSANHDPHHFFSRQESEQSLPTDVTEADSVAPRGEPELPSWPLILSSMSPSRIEAEMNSWMSLLESDYIP